jgi:hypothetical protein
MRAAPSIDWIIALFERIDRRSSRVGISGGMDVR